MSYCRFSSDNFKSDVYVYESSEGYVTFVASRRLKGEVPFVDWKMASQNPELWAAQNKAQREFLDSVPFEAINHPEAGKTYLDRSLEELLARLRWLRREGFHIPEGVIECIVDEIVDELGG